MKRRLLAIAMTLAMALSLLPVTALAGEADQTQSSVTVTGEPDQTDPTNGPSEEEAGSETTSESRTETADCPGGDNCAHAAAIGDTHYDTLQEAITAVSENGTITLIQNFTQNSALTVTDKTFTLDMAGKTITLGNIEDNSGAILLNGSSNVTINGDGSFTYDEETYAGESSQSSGQMIGVDGNATLTIENGDFHAGLVCVRAGENAKVYIEGGKFYADATYDNRVWVLNKQDNENATFYVTGGTFVNYDPSNSDTENPTDNFVASGYTVVESEGTYIVVPLTEENAVAQVGDDYYATLAEAINAVEPGETIVLQKDIEECELVDINKSGVEFVINFNNHKLQSVSKSFAINVQAGNVTLQNGTVSGGLGGINCEAGANLTLVEMDVSQRKAESGETDLSAIKNSGTVTIKSGTYNTANGTAQPTIWNFAEMVIKGGTFKTGATDSGWSVMICRGGETTSTNTKITGGTFINEVGYGITCSNGGNVEFGGTAKVQSVAPALGGNNTTAEENFTVTGGELVSSQNAAIFFPAEGELNISGGTITGLTGIHALMGDINISGGTITGNASENDIEEGYPNSGTGPRSNGSALLLVSNYYTTSATGDNGLRVTITGGTFNKSAEMKDVGVIDHLKPDDPKDTEFTISITGGNFSAEPEKDYIATGYAAVKDESTGTWTVGVADGMEASTDADGDTASATVGGNFTTSGSNGDNVSTDESATVKISVTTGDEGTENTSVTTTNVTIAPESLSSVSNADGIENVEIATDVGTLTVSKAAWDTITDNAKGESVTLSISQAQAADSDSNKPLAYELTATANGEDVFAQGGDNGTITVNVPYTADNGTVHVYYVGDSGAEALTGTVLDNRLTWDVTHFSTYVVTQDETGAFAATKDGDTTNITTYESLDAALTDLADNENDTVTISLLDGSTHTLSDANYTVKAKLTISGNATINATPASGQRTKVFTIVNNGKLTLNDLTLNMTGTTNAEDQKKEGDGINVKYGAELVLNNATVTFDDMFSPMVFEATSGITTLGKVTVNNSTITATGTRGNFSNGGEWTIENNSSVTIDGCGTHGLSVETVTIDNSKVTVKNTSWVGVYGSEITLENGATLEVTNCATDENIGENYKDKGAVQIKSSEESSLTVTDSTMTLSNNGNGASEGEQSIYVPAGATYTNNGTVTGTVASSGEAMIDGKVYDTLAKAIENAQNGDVVTLLKDVELDGTDKNNNEGLLDISKSITLDGNEHKITAKNVTVAEGTSNGPSMINITGDIKVTVRDLTIDGAGSTDAATDNTKHGLNIYGGADVTVENVTIQNGNGYAIVANGSTVTVNGLTTSNNSWGGINVDSKSGEASLTVEDATIHENNSIKFENSSTAPKNDDPSAEIKDGDFQYITAGSEIDTENLDLTISGGTFATGSYEGALSVGNYLEDGLAIDSNGNVYQPSQGGSSGGSSVTRYNVTVEDTDNGSIRVSPSRASRGQTVTITVDPDEGYELDRLVVRDSDGDRIDLERKSDTKYTFEMPRGKVTVEATFTEIEEEDAIPFRDVDTDDWFYDAVVYAYDNDLMSGVSDDQFAPDATLTRAMVAQMLYSLEGKPRTGSAGYADVAFGAWYEDAVAWISSEGLMPGYSDAAFGPNDPLTREQLALILYNYADWAGYDVRGGVSLGSYIDADSASTWAVEALEWAIDAGLISGRGDGILAPAGTATRAEVAQIFMNFLENVAQ